MIFCKNKRTRGKLFKVLRFIKYEIKIRKYFINIEHEQILWNSWCGQWYAWWTIDWKLTFWLYSAQLEALAFYYYRMLLLDLCLYLQSGNTVRSCWACNKQCQTGIMRDIQRFASCTAAAINVWLRRHDEHSITRRSVPIGCHRSTPIRLLVVHNVIWRSQLFCFPKYLTDNGHSVHHQLPVQETKQFV